VPEDLTQKERYARAMPILAELLHIQAVFVGQVVLVDQGRINAKALGYIYGLADCALQIGMMDVGSQYGLGVLMALIMEFDEPNADMLWQYLQTPGDAGALMDGVSLGFEDYLMWSKSGGKGAPPLRWVKCFRDGSRNRG
jgi:hypothetical protein